MSVWDTLVGQDKAVEQLKTVVAGGTDDLAQSWLICGPTGSGRAQMARAFAAALEDPEHSDDSELSNVARQVFAGTHPDVTVVSTSGTTIGIDRVRELIGQSEQMPSTAPWRIIIIEDFERMLERTTNVLLKEVEEPSAHMIWLLCAPSAQDVLPTIRSRTRLVNLAVPTDEAVAAYLATLPEVDATTAHKAARYAQGNLNEARLYATDAQAMSDRDVLVRGVLKLERASQAIALTEQLMDAAQDQAQTEVEQQAGVEQREFLRLNGFTSEKDLPRQLRAEYQKLAKKKDLKSLAKRRVRDVLDRALTTVASVYRDVAVLQNDADETNGLVNREYRTSLEKLAHKLDRAETVKRMDAVTICRRRIAGNGNAKLDVDALFCRLLVLA